MTLHKKNMRYKGNGHQWSARAAAAAQTTWMRASVLPWVMTMVLMMIYSRLARGPFEAGLIFQSAGCGVGGSAEGFRHPPTPHPPETPLGRSHVLNLLEGGRKFRRRLYSRGQRKFGSYYWGPKLIFFFTAVWYPDIIQFLFSDTDINW